MAKHKLSYDFEACVWLKFSMLLLYHVSAYKYRILTVTCFNVINFKISEKDIKNKKAPLMTIIRFDLIFFSCVMLWIQISLLFEIERNQIMKSWVFHENILSTSKTNRNTASKPEQKYMEIVDFWTRIISDERSIPLLGFFLALFQCALSLFKFSVNKAFSLWIKTNHSASSLYLVFFLLFPYND